MADLNDASINLITEFEGWVPNWYPDPAHGWAVPTCCYGHTDAAGEPKYAATKDQVFTKPEGRAILQQDLRKYSAAVDRLVKVPLNANQYGALTSFTYNLGEGNLAKSTLLKKLNAGDYKGAAAEFAKWNRASGSVMAGLTRRRKAEAELFLTPMGASAQAPKPIIPVEPAPAPAPATPKPRAWAALIAVFGPILYGIGKYFGIVP